MPWGMLNTKGTACCPHTYTPDMSNHSQGLRGTNSPQALRKQKMPKLLPLPWGDQDTLVKLLSEKARDPQITSTQTHKPRAGLLLEVGVDGWTPPLDQRSMRAAVLRGHAPLAESVVALPRATGPPAASHTHGSQGQGHAKYSPAPHPASPRQPASTSPGAHGACRAGGPP